jgi:hypothetical protein
MISGRNFTRRSDSTAATKSAGGSSSLRFAPVRRSTPAGYDRWLAEDRKTRPVIAAHRVLGRARIMRMRYGVTE